MRKAIRMVVAASALFFLTAGAASACVLEGYVKCDVTGEGVANAKITVEGVGSAVTGADGFYSIALPDAGTYTATIDLAGVPGGSVVSPGVSATFTNNYDTSVVDWIVTASVCQKAACWLTAGGAKFSPVTGTLLAEKGPQISFGGNVYPGCSSTAGEGGNWNHVDHGQKLHFQGTSIVVDDCGPIFENGSDSPKTPYNWIKFHGTGKLAGIGGFKPDVPAVVCFSAEAQDRNEPGSSGTRDGRLIDRYQIHVTNCDTGAILLFLSMGSVMDPVVPANTDPLTITDGNMQIHISSCTQ